jgi:hypothetical protein
MFSVPNKIDNRPFEPPKEKCSNKSIDEEKVRKVQALWRGYYVRKALAQQSALLKVVQFKK